MKNFHVTKTSRYQFSVIYKTKSSAQATGSSDLLLVSHHSDRAFPITAA